MITIIAFEQILKSFKENTLDNDFSFEPVIGSSCPNSLFSGGTVSGGALGFGPITHNENNQRAFLPLAYSVPPYDFTATAVVSAEANFREKSRKRSLAAIFFALISAMLFSCKLPADIEKIQIVNPDISRVADGTWIGEWKTSMINAQTAVTVAGGSITAIKLLKHEHGRGGPAEVIVERVREMQSLEVAAVSGATGSSKVILKSIEQALLNGIGGR